jgi:hypothetical protein
VIGDVSTLSEIAFEYCPFDASSSFARPDYKETCREVATGICEGAVGGKVKDNGCSISDNNLARLQKKCENQVNSMTGGDTVRALLTCILTFSTDVPLTLYPLFREVIFRMGWPERTSDGTL